MKSIGALRRLENLWEHDVFTSRRRAFRGARHLAAIPNAPLTHPESACPSTFDFLTKNNTLIPKAFVLRLSTFDFRLFTNNTLIPKALVLRLSTFDFLTKQ